MAVASLLFGRLTRMAVVVLLLAAMAGVGVRAFTASNTVGASSAGDGSGAISGYTISAIHYNLDSTNPQDLDSLTFTLDSAPPSGSTIKVRTPSTGAWITCANTGASVTCPGSGSLSGVTVASLDTLEVVAAQ